MHFLGHRRHLRRQRRPDWEMVRVRLWYSFAPLTITPTRIMILAPQAKEEREAQ